MGEGQKNLEGGIRALDGNPKSAASPGDGKPVWSGSLHYKKTYLAGFSHYNFFGTETSVIDHQKNMPVHQLS